MGRVLKVLASALLYVELGLHLLGFFDGVCKRFFCSHQTNIVHIIFIRKNVKFIVSIAV
jgi:hypothetical protein